MIPTEQSNNSHEQYNVCKHPYVHGNYEVMTMLNVPFSIRLVNKEELDEIARKQPAMLANLRAKYSEDKYDYGVPDYDEKSFSPFCPCCEASGVQKKMALRSHAGRLLKRMTDSGTKGCVVIRPSYECETHGIMAVHTIEMDGRKKYEKDIVSTSSIYHMLTKTKDIIQKMISFSFEESSEGGSFVNTIKGLLRFDSPGTATITRWASEYTRICCEAVQAFALERGMQFLDMNGKPTFEGRRFVRQALEKLVFHKASGPGQA